MIDDAFAEGWDASEHDSQSIIQALSDSMEWLDLFFKTEGYNEKHQEAYAVISEAIDTIAIWSQEVE